MIRTTIFSLAFAFILASTNCSIADEGQPVAIRSWPDGGITIETMWNLHCSSNLSDKAKKMLPRDVDLAVDHLDVDSATLRRSVNEHHPKTLKNFDGKPAANDLVIYKNKPLPDDSDSPSFVIGVQVDGVDVLNINQLRSEQVLRAIGDEAKQQQPEKHSLLGSAIGRLLLPDFTIEFDVIIANTNTYDEASLNMIAAKLQPRIMIVHPSVKKVGDAEVIAVKHNTVAVAFKSGDKKVTTRFVSLTDQPYEMSAEVAELFQKKEAACKKSRSLFATLSVPQLNCSPANGTHTPRWNTEHMMGRELLFFSQIYHAMDSSIQVMDLNPRQMPKQYKMAHPDWNGEEEARQTERVESFTRRFAYLLDGVDLNRKAKGSKFWTPRSLLKQMERHYGEHTKNVQKKMQLKEWPNE